LASAAAGRTYERPSGRTSAELPYFRIGIAVIAGTIGSVPLALFAGICVSDFQAALPWYERLLRSEPSFLPHATEAVWELAEQRNLYIEEDAARAGYARQTLFVDDLDSVMSEIATRGIEPAEVETYSNGVRKALYRDADGNEVGFGGAPA